MHITLHRHSGPVRAALRASNSFGLVLALLLLDFFLLPAVSLHHWSDLVTLLLPGITMLFALHTAGARTLTMRISIGIVVVAVICAVAVNAAEGAGWMNGAVTGNRSVGVIAVLDSIMLIIAPPAILRRVLMTAIVDGETILGALSVYVILGLLFASVFTAIGAFSSVPFFSGVTAATASQFQFFSFTTLTTVGYGNLVPATQSGQSLAVLEALLGQIYLVTLVAALVSRFQPGERLRQRRGSAPDVIPPVANDEEPEPVSDPV